MERVELKGEAGFNLGAARADIEHGHGLEHHDFPFHSLDGDALVVALVAAHSRLLIWGRRGPLQHRFGAAGRDRRGGRVSPAVSKSEEHVVMGSKARACPSTNAR